MEIVDYKINLREMPIERRVSFEDKILGKRAYTLGDSIEGRSKYLTLLEVISQ